MGEKVYRSAEKMVGLPPTFSYVENSIREVPVMRLALICPSNRLFMPYVNNYEEVLDKFSREYVTINWDRFGMEPPGDFTYRDNKIGHQRNVFDYYKYCRFVESILAKYRFDRVIVFGLQISFFLQRILMKRYQNNYIIDIRDYNKIVEFWNPKRLLEHSFYTVISSPGYLEWLPNSVKYLVNHNTTISGVELLYPSIAHPIMGKIAISQIGAIRDYAINVEMLESLKNHRKVSVYYHGDGHVADRLNSYVQKNDFENVVFTGRYGREEEANLYLSSDIINVLRYDDSLNNRTALPNRLYNAPLYGKPLLAYRGTYLAQQIEMYRLGLVVDSFADIFETLDNYFGCFDQKGFDKGREEFFEDIIADNTLFGDAVNRFCL